MNGFLTFVPMFLAGLVVGLALIPESIAFSAIAGVDPQVGLYASFCIAVSIAFFGGRPAMISAATGAMALLHDHTGQRAWPTVFTGGNHSHRCHSDHCGLF